MADRKSYEDFLQEGDKEKDLRDKVLKRGVVHEIHMAEDAIEETDLSDYYTKSQIDALLAALVVTGGLDTCISSPIRHDFLMYDEVALCWKNFNIDLDFEDWLDYTFTNIWEALTALIRIEDGVLAGGIIIEDAL